MTKALTPVRVPLQRVQYQLLTVWMAGVGPIYLWLMMILVLDTFEGGGRDIVGWIISGTMPTVLLIAGGLGAGAVIEAKKKIVRKPADDGSTGEIETLLVPEDVDTVLLVDRRFGRLAIGLSAGYLLLFGLALVFGVRHAQDAIELVTIGEAGQDVVPAPFKELVQDASLLLGPLNGLVAAVLGALFVSAGDK